MRIIAGKLKGRNFDSPPGNRTHPMGDKIRGALFNVLGDIEGLSLLDAYAGSGACSFEALSRGASLAVAIDVDKAAATTISKNMQALGTAGKTKVVQANIGSWSKNNTAETFDLVLLDPPYDDVKPDLLKELANHAKMNGLIIMSLPPSHKVELSESFDLLVRKSYGDATLSFYRRLR